MAQILLNLDCEGGTTMPHARRAGVMGDPCNHAAAAPFQHSCADGCMRQGRGDSQSSQRGQAAEMWRFVFVALQQRGCPDAGLPAHILQRLGHGTAGSAQSWSYGP